MISRNRYFNNEAFGTAAANLAGLFQPPEAADVANYALADERRAKLNQLAWLFDNPDDPTASKRSSLTGVQGYGQTPEGYRYGIDTQASTALSTNAADNARALAERQMIEEATTQRLGIPDVNARYKVDSEAVVSGSNNLRDNQTKAINTLLGPLDPGQVRPEVAADVMGLLEMPAIGSAAGAPKPLSETEWGAQQRARLLDNGQLTDEMLIDTIMGERAPVQAIGPDGRTPVYMSPGAAVRERAQPYDAPTDKALVEGTAVIEGKSVQVYRDPRESLYRTADGRPVPADVQVFDKAKPTGTNEQLGMKPTEFTERSGMFAARAGVADNTMTKLQQEGYVPSARDFELILGGAGETLPLSLSNSLVSKEGQQFYNSAMNFMLSVLRPDTGAAFGRDEFQNYARVFIPLPGDDPAVIAEKGRARATALAALQGVSRGASEEIIQRMIDNGVQVPDEMLRAFERAQSGVTGQFQLQAQPQAGTDAPAAYEDGTVIVKPGTNDRMIRQNGKWEPYNG